VRILQLLPLSQDQFQPEPGEVIPQIRSEYLFEPNPRLILDELLPYYIENTLYQTLLEAKASEHSARMVAMKNASDNARSLVSELKLLFNKSRQAAITSELLDITTATLTVEG
jgi:F-type H+-transporting ATPase subunit gamma